MSLCSCLVQVFEGWNPAMVDHQVREQEKDDQEGDVQHRRRHRRRHRGPLGKELVVQVPPGSGKGFSFHGYLFQVGDRVSGVRRPAGSIGKRLTSFAQERFFGIPARWRLASRRDSRRRFQGNERRI